MALIASALLLTTAVGASPPSLQKSKYSYEEVKAYVTRKVAKTCSRQQWPPKDGCDFTCPENSCAKGSNVCIDDIQDCQCVVGYKMSEDGRCERPKCVTGDMMYSEGYYHKRKGCDFVCPENSCARGRSQDCIRDMDDCRCRIAWTREGDICVPKKCEFDGYEFQQRQWRDNNCQCRNGAWVCNSGEPEKCTFEGNQFEDGAWRDNYCICNNGQWDCDEKPPPSPPSPQTTPEPQPGCVGSLPFGLENCVCDGASAGEAAGIAACGRVFNECASSITPFSSDNLLEAVQRICDSFALDGCLSASRTVIQNFPGCADILRNGTPLCSPQQAMELFERSIAGSCDPLCPNCERLELF